MLKRALLASVLICGCGGPEEGSSFHDVSGDRTVRRQLYGHFVVRLVRSPGLGLHEISLDEVTAQIAGETGRDDAKLTSRFEGMSLPFGGDGRNIDQLFKLFVPGVETEEANREMFARLKALPSFAAIDTDKSMQPQQIDPGYGDGRQYYLDTIRWRDAMALAGLAEPSDGAPVVVGVFDTGVSATHEDLREALWRSPDDGLATGYDAFRNAAPTGVDRAGHGTGVAGIIAARGGNGVGIQGAASNSAVELMDVVTLDQEEAGTSELIGRATYWALSVHEAQRERVPGRQRQKLIVNLSLAGPFDAAGYAFDRNPDGTPVLRDDVLDLAREHDVLIVAAAGNESCELGGACGIDGRDYAEAYYYPCSYEGVLCVAASTHEDRLAGFSNRGKSVGLTAPGWGLYTTSIRSGDSGYAYLSGTSAAAPLVTAIAATVWSAFPQLSADDVKRVLQRSAAQLPEVAGGRLDALAAMQLARNAVETGVSPDEAELPLLVTEAVTPPGAPQLPGDPYAKSGSAFGTGGKAEEPVEEKSKNEKPLGCGTVAAQDGWGWGLAVLLLPLVVLTIRLSASRAARRATA